MTLNVTRLAPTGGVLSRFAAFAARALADRSGTDIGGVNRLV